jgi:hypothetical protein
LAAAFSRSTFIPQIGSRSMRMSLYSLLPCIHSFIIT